MTEQTMSFSDYAVVVQQMPGQLASGVTMLSTLPAPIARSEVGVAPVRQNPRNRFLRSFYEFVGH
ncbi:MAG: hypothetical protein ACREBU_08980 [Nitrososphaera sp.]